MKSLTLEPLQKNVEIEYTGYPVQLSAKRENDIENFWIKINQDQTFHRGEVFTVDTITEEEDAYKIIVNLTDYAHYLHTIKNHLMDEEACRVVFGAGLVETIDSIYVFGQMADHTAHPGRLQCVGGGLTWEDKKGERFDIRESVLRELQEELGVASKHINLCTPVFIKTGGTYNAIVILFHIKVNLSREELTQNYYHFTQELIAKNVKPEFQEIIFVENSIDAVENFIANEKRHCEDYLKPFLKQMTK